MRTTKRIKLAAAAAGTLVLGLSLACSNDAAKKEDAAPSGGTGSGGDGGVPETGTSFHTGFDGETDFSILLPNFRRYTITDESIAKVEAVEVQLSTKIVDDLVAAAKAKHPDFDVERFRQMFTRKRTTYRITPLKPGVTTIQTQRGFGRGMLHLQGGGRDTWGASTNIKLVITEYAPGQVDAGKRRYETTGEGTLKACKSCHDGGHEDAPPHELGRIMEISDKQALEWITTGKTGGRKAKITHEWEFSSEDERKGIVPYVRSLQTHDVEMLTKLYFEEQLEAGDFFRGGRRGGRGGGEGGSSTGTSTGTGTGG